MKHSGKAQSAAFNLIFWSLAGLVALIGAGLIGAFASDYRVISMIGLLAVWFVFVIFTFYFFRDPEARVPTEPGLVVSPGHGTVDIIDRIKEPLFIGGECQRVSIFLSVFNVHVQNAPIGGKLAYYKYTTGQFLNAMKSESAAMNENALMGIESAERPGTKVGLRLIAGLIARRIVPFAVAGENLQRGERISLIQFGSRVDLYLPLTAKIKTKLGERVVGGESILATLD